MTRTTTCRRDGNGRRPSSMRRVEGHDGARPFGAGAAARFVRRWRPGVIDHLEARGDGGRADADPGVLRRPAPGGPGLSNFWGYNTIGFFAPRRATSRPGSDVHRVQADGAAAARRDRGDPRRGLQPHRRGQPSRADPEFSRNRQTRPAVSRPTIRRYSTTTGSSNTVNITHQRVLQMVMDSLTGSR